MSDMQPFRQWLAENDVEVDPRVSIVRDARDGSVRVVARARIPRRETICRIPRSLVLSRKTSWLAQRLDRLDSPAAQALEQLSPPLVLAVHVLYELARGPASRWYGYFEKSCPSRAVDIALLWAPTALARTWITGTQLERHLAHVEVDPTVLSQTFDRVVVPLQLDPHSHSHSRRPVSLETFTYAYSLVCSRAFAVDRNYHGLSLVPLADAFNHASPGENDVELCVDEEFVCPVCGSVQECAHEHEDDDVTVGTPPRKLNDDDDDEDDDVIEMITTAHKDELEAGQEVYNSYGPLSNSTLVAEYGFKLEANASDRVTFTRSELDKCLLRLGARRRSPDPPTGVADVYNAADDDDDEHPLIANLDVSAPPRSGACDFYFDADAKVSRALWTTLVASLEQTTDNDDGPHALAHVIARIVSGNDDDDDDDDDGDALSSHRPHRPPPPPVTAGTTLESLARLSNAIERLCDDRIEGQHRSDLAVSQLFDLAEEERDATVKIAIEIVAEERLLLERVRSNWRSLSQTLNDTIMSSR